MELEGELDVRQDVGPGEGVCALDAADGLDDVRVGPAAEGDGADAGLLAHELGEDGAGAGAVAVVDDDDVFCRERLCGDVAPVLVAGYVDAAAVFCDERV